MTDYLDWQSDLSLEQVFAASDPFSYPDFSVSSGASRLVYLSHLTSDGGRAALMLEGGSEPISHASYSLRTKINEYGGKPYWLCGDNVVFASQRDQCLYRQPLSGRVEEPDRTKELVKTQEPLRISPAIESHALMYSDVIELHDELLLAIVEQEVEGCANQSYLGLLNPNQPNQMPRRLTEGADFYSNLVIDTQAQRIAWVQWNHPGMPWDSNQLWVADYQFVDLESSQPEQLTTLHRVALPESACVCQVFFSNNGRLFFSADFAGASSDNSKNYWNIFAYSCTDQRLSSVTELNIEFGYPHWVYGDSRIAQYDATTLLAIGSAPEGDALYAIDQQSLAVKVVTGFEAGNHNTLKALVADGQGHAAMMLLPRDQNPELIRVSGRLHEPLIKTVIRSPAHRGGTSLAHHFAFGTRDREQAFGFYYPPSNIRYTDAVGLPPLIVMVHGGPTSRAYGFFDIQKQFWTSRGFALFDVNHRGSSGYGRHYRDALYENWGELDAADIVDGVQHLIRQGKADPDRLCIRGKSAGGYAVLRALTEYPQVFKAGACYYGIGNLATLAEVTHKFEQFYTDRLVGEQYDINQSAQAGSLYHQRSPIHKINQLQSAMIVFQGLQDKVVPPAVAQEVIAALKAAELEHSYVEYAEEGHGFRQAANNIDAWGKELAFYRKVLN